MTATAHTLAGRTNRRGRNVARCSCGWQSKQEEHRVTAGDAFLAHVGVVSGDPAYAHLAGPEWLAPVPDCDFNRSGDWCHVCQQGRDRWEWSASDVVVVPFVYDVDALVASRHAAMVAADQED